MKYPLNSDDDTYRDLRDLPLHLVGKMLQQKARECAEFIKKKDELHSIIEIKNYVKKLPRLVFILFSLSSFFYYYFKVFKQCKRAQIFTQTL